MSEKAKKKKGPIRFEAIVPVAVLLTLLCLYFSFLFDAHLRKGMEWTGSYIHGAEVNIAEVDTSLLGAYFTVRGLQVTDKKDPRRNLVAIGRIHLGLLWDALLRAKFVVTEAAIEDIQAYSPRKRPGKIYPKGEDKSAIKKVEDSVMEQAKDDFNDNVLGDVAQVVSGVDPNSQLKKIEGDLKSSSMVKDLEKTLDEKKAKWEQTIKNLPKESEIKKYEQRIKNLEFDTKNPKAFAESLKEAQEIIKEVDREIKTVKAASEDFDSDVSGFNSEIKQIDAMIKQDLKDLEKRLKIPSLDVASFSKGIFGKLFAEQLASLGKYQEVAREYMPAKNNKAKSDTPPIVPRKRGEGRNYQFPITTGYPLFWLQKGVISSKANPSGYSGNVKGTLSNVTTSPAHIGEPAIAELKGDFPKQGVAGLDAKLTIDHTSEDPVESLNAKIETYPVGAKKLSDSEDVQFQINGARGQADLNAELRGENLTVELKNWFKEVQYDVRAKSQDVQDVLRGVVDGIPEIYVEAKASGKWTGLKWDLYSNLGDALSKGFKQQIQAKIDEAKAKLEAQVRERIEAEKAKLEKQFNKVKGQVNKAIASKKDEIDKAKKTAKNALESKKQSSGIKKLEKEGKKAVDKLKKSLGF